MNRFISRPINLIRGKKPYKINGQTYYSLDEMPDHIRSFFESKKDGEQRADLDDQAPNINAADTEQAGTQQSYNYNHKVYNSLEDMPESIQTLLKNSSGDAIASEKISRHVTSSYTINGVEYGSLDEIPDDIKATMQHSGILKDDNNNGIPDIMENMLKRD